MYNENTAEFEATARFKATGSSFVEEVAYDGQAQELLVLVDSGSAYLYKGVDSDTFHKFHSAHSRGQFYNNWIKGVKNFGPGQEVFWDTQIVDKPVDAPDMGAVTVSAPKNFTFTAARNSGVFSTYSLPSAVFDLAPAVDAPVEEFLYSHTVDYTVDGGNKIYSTTVEAGKGVFDGIDKVVANLDALNLDYEIKGVHVKVND